MQPNIIKKIKKDYKKNLVRDIKLFLKKKKKQQYGLERYKNLPEDEKQSLLSIEKNVIK